MAVDLSRINSSPAGVAGRRLNSTHVSGPHEKVNILGSVYVQYNVQVQCIYCTVYIYMLCINHGEIINMERPRGVTCVKTAGGRTLCILDRGKGLYG